MAGDSTEGTPPPTPGPGELYPGQSAPLATLTPTDQSGVVVIATTLALVLALTFMIIRMYVRLQFQRGFARDDIASVVSTVTFITQSGLVFGQVHHGFGKTIDDITPAGLLASQKIGYSSDIFYILAVFFTKCSITLFFVRLSPDRNHMRAATVCLGVITLFTVGSILATTLRCDLSSPWVFIGTRCPGLLVRWQAVAVFDIISEVAIFAVSVYMVRNLKLSTAKKSAVFFAFGIRLLVVIPIIVRLLFLDSEFSGVDPTLDGVMAVVCTQIHISFAIMATVMPCLRPFMSALSTHYGGQAEVKTPGNTVLSKLTGNSDRSHRENKEAKKLEFGYALDDITAVGDRCSRHTDIETGIAASGGVKTAHQPPARWDGSDYRVAVSSKNLSVDGNSTQRNQSNESQRMIISKNTEWQVEFQTEETWRPQGTRHSYG
ncbi:hypothetical protein OQA88_2270 [Cercophora sp. LCS_1]